MLKLEKPKLQRAYITVTDPETKKSLCLTVYGTTPSQIIGIIEAEAKDKGKRSKKSEIRQGDAAETAA